MYLFFLLWIGFTALLSQDISLLLAIFCGFPAAVISWLCLAVAGFDMDFLEQWERRFRDWDEKDDE